MIKNERIREKIKKKTIGDDVLEAFISEIVGYEYEMNQQFASKYKGELEKAMKKLGEIRNHED